MRSYSPKNLRKPANDANPPRIGRNTIITSPVEKILFPLMPGKSSANKNSRKRAGGKTVIDPGKQILPFDFERGKRARCSSAASKTQQRYFGGPFQAGRPGPARLCIHRRALLKFVARELAISQFTRAPVELAYGTWSHLRVLLLPRPPPPRQPSRRVPQLLPVRRAVSPVPLWSNR